MKHKENDNAAIDVVDDTGREAQVFIKDVFRLLSEQVKQVTDDVAKFNEKRKVVKERIQRGARKTSGRIV